MDTPDLLSAAAGLLTGILSSYVASQLHEANRSQRGSLKLRRILNVGHDNIVFVLQDRGRAPESIMPRVAVEDILAMNNMVSLLAGARPRIRPKIRDHERVQETDRSRDIISLGGPMNKYTAEILARTARPGIAVTEDASGLRTLHVDGMKFDSQSRHVADSAAPELPRDDIGFIAKLPNPDEPSRNVLIVAGLRGIGTWGAADYLRKHIGDVYALKRSSGKMKHHGHFLLVLEVHYRDFNVRSCDVRHFQDIS
jgi:hypothetical protein